MRIWFNHWFSTAYHLINMIRSANPDFYFIGTGSNPWAIYKRACNEWYEEPENLAADEYVDFCLKFCRENGIDIFIPRRNLHAIVEHAESFEQMGVRLFAHRDSKLIGILNDKLATYDYFRPHVPDCIPEIRVAHSVEEFSDAYEELKNNCKRVCYKLVEDEGARSFRVIDERIESASALLEKPGAKITYSAALRVLADYDFSTPILLMPYLRNVEISADCLKTAKGNLVLPRFKSSKRYSEVIMDPEIQALCSKMIDIMGIEMPLNIQFKCEGKQLYLLEINPRMSGGLQLSCQASGINIPDIAINQILGKDIDWTYPDFYSKKVAHIETPITLT